MGQVNIGKVHPDSYKALLALSDEADSAAEEAGLSARLIDLIKLRVSQLNGCAFCLRMHSRDALDKGESADRLAVVAAWWESQYFSDQERAALSLAEEVTQLDAAGRHSVDASDLSAEQVSAITWLAIVMNSWNRVAVHSRYAVGP